MSEVELNHTAVIRVRYADTDKMGYVYNGNYFAFFEVGRTELMRAYGLKYLDLENSGYLLPLSESYAKYVSPAYYDDDLEVKARLLYGGGAKLKFDYEIYRKGELITVGYTTHMFVKADSRKPVKPPKIFLDIVSSLNL